MPPSAFDALGNDWRGAGAADYVDLFTAVSFGMALMRAVAARAGRLELVEVPRPEPGDGEVLVRVLACGICTSDVHFLAHGEEFVRTSIESGGRFGLDLSRDVIMGHEFCGQVEIFGPGCSRSLQPGDRVTSVPPHGAFSTEFSGAYAEFMLINERQALLVPDHVPSELAAMTEPLAVGRHAVNAARFAGGEAAIVYGCGPIGLAVLAHLRSAGAGMIVASDPASSRRRLASLMGADLTIDPREYPPVEAVRVTGEYGSGQGVVMFDAIGAPGSLALLMRDAPLGGARIVVVGACLQEDRIAPMAGIEKELELKFVLAYAPAEFQAALDGISRGEIDPAPLISGRIGLDEVAAAFKALADPERHCKVMINPLYVDSG
jgi:threonine dehydrogenase-like Zn-dependent dehydrogenase